MAGENQRQPKNANGAKVTQQSAHAQAVEDFKTDIVRHLRRTIGTSPEKASNLAWWRSFGCNCQ